MKNENGSEPKEAKTQDPDAILQECLRKVDESIRVYLLMVQITGEVPPPKSQEEAESQGLRLGASYLRHAMAEIMAVLQMLGLDEQVNRKIVELATKTIEREKKKNPEREPDTMEKFFREHERQLAMR